MKTIPATQAQRAFGELLDTAQREPVIVTKKNRPVGVMLSMEEARKLFDIKVEAAVQRGLEDVKKGHFQDLSSGYGVTLRERFEAERVKQKSDI